MMGVLFVVLGFCCVAWIIHTEVMAREMFAQTRRGERRISGWRAFGIGLLSGLQMWVVGGAGVALVVLGVVRLAGG